MSTRLKSKTARPAVTKGRGLRTLRSVDTNVSSYDRTDPFTALNTLLKLLVSLPTRLGGCQYKLTPDEHALSLHLLNIVEPFVGVAESQRSFTRQPTELLDAIAAHVDSRADLLSLALSCKRMHTVVCPRHLDYRVVRARASSLRVWYHFSVNRALARNVRVLEVLDERSGEAEVLPPGILTTDTDLESTDDELGMHVKQEKFLISALKQMNTLRMFTWSSNHSLVSLENIWPTLMKCHALTQIDVNDNLVFHAPSEEETSTGKKKRTAVLPDLRTVALKSTKHAYGATKTPCLDRVSAMLNSCPNLENLAVGYSARRGADYLNPVADDFLLCGRWPRLQSLSLTNLWYSAHTGVNVAASFLYAHANLQVLHIDVSFGAGAGPGHIILPPDSLPHLREVKSSKEFVTALLQCPTSVKEGRPLETIKGVRLSGGGRDDRFLQSLKLYGSESVKRIELAGWNEVDDVKKFVECVPKLVWLDVGKRMNGAATVAAACVPSGSGKATSTVHANVAEWIQVLQPLAELTTFHGVRLFYELSSVDPSGPITLSERSKMRKNEEISSLLAWKCPKLRRLDHWEEGPGKVVVLIRDGEKVRYEVRRVKL